MSTCRAHPLLLLTASVALTALAASRAGAAPRLGPPSLYLQDEPHRVAVVEARGVVDDGRAAFVRRQLLLGDRAEEEMPPELVVRMGPEALAAIEIGRTYVLGYTRLRPAARQRRVYEEDPLGPSVVALPGVGDALLDDTPAIRRLVTTPAEGDRRTLEAVLDQLARPGALSQRFAAAELLLRRELQELVTAADVKRLQAVLAAPELDPMAHDVLLRAAEPLAARFGGEWLAEDCRRVLKAHGTELDLHSFVPSLVLTAARILGKVGNRDDVPLLARHLLSNNPGVAKAALPSMAALDPVATGERVRELVARDDLLAETRRVLERYLNQRAEGGQGG
ncbi:MAG: hypothetical protein D6696_05145 [Acidobacteria bacterium]|nr:MAG: hypothetical protein D6696_05145 [Acidobacteriota bacterium]